MQIASLSGWMRLGIVLSIIWGSLVSSVAYKNYPTDPWRVVSAKRVLSTADIELAIELAAAQPNIDLSYVRDLEGIWKDVKNNNNPSGGLAADLYGPQEHVGVKIPDIGLVYFPAGMSDEKKIIVIQKVLIPQHARSLAIISGAVDPIYKQDLESLTEDQLLGMLKYSNNVQERLSYIKKSAIEKSERLEKIHQAQVRHCLEALALWLGGVFFLFGGSWTIRWIYRGFRKADT